MANLISIDSLTICNFGPFYGTTEFDFVTDHNGPPHVLIGGKNGAGKTHVLRAMYLAVVGQAGVGDLRKVESGADATGFTFDSVINRRAAREGEDTCKLKVVIRQRDADSTKNSCLHCTGKFAFVLPRHQSGDLGLKDQTKSRKWMTIN